MRLNQAQRIVIVIGLAAIAIAVDRAAVTDRAGWFGYAPSTGEVFDPDGGLQLGNTGALVLRVVLATTWTAAGLLLLASKKDAASPMP